MPPERSRTVSERLHERAQEVFPGGVSHNVRHFEPYPTYIERAEGPYVFDVDGNRYVDFWNHGVCVLGHAHPEVVEAVEDQASDGLYYGAVNELALELAEKVQEYVPSAERVRYCVSGTEATMYAVRLARAYTDRKYVLKAEGGWHGGNTDLSWATRPPFDQPSTAGLPPGATENVEAFPVNDEAAVESLLDRHEGDVAAVIVEPLMAAGGGVRVREDFLSFLKAESEARGFQLVFDEVVTGFRVSPGSYQARIDVLPDLTTLGKFLGGGLAVGAVCGRAELFENARPDVDIRPDERVIAGGGTFSANPMTTAAGLASLEVLEREPVWEHTESGGKRIREGLAAIFEDRGIDAEVLGESSMFLSHFQPEAPLEDARAIKEGTNREALFAFRRRLHDHGFYVLPATLSRVSYQMTDEHLDGFVEAADEVVADLQAEGGLEDRSR